MPSTAVKFGRPYARPFLSLRQGGAFFMELFCNVNILS